MRHSRMSGDYTPCHVHTSLNWSRRTRAHKTISRANPPSRGRRSLLASKASWVHLPWLRRHKRWMIARASFCWNRLSATEVSMVCEMFICKCLQVCTGIKKHPTDWTVRVKNLGRTCQRGSLSREILKVNPARIDDQNKYIKYLLMANKQTHCRLADMN